MWQNAQMYTFCQPSLFEQRDHKTGIAFEFCAGRPRHKYIRSSLTYLPLPSHCRSLYPLISHCLPCISLLYSLLPSWCSEYGEIRMVECGRSLVDGGMVRGCSSGTRRSGLPMEIWWKRTLSPASHTPTGTYHVDLSL